MIGTVPFFRGKKLKSGGHLGSDFRHYGHALYFASIPGWEE